VLQARRNAARLDCAAAGPRLHQAGVSKAVRRRAQAERASRSEESVKVAAPVVSTEAPLAPAPRQYEIIDGVDERLLPWSFDD